MSLALYPNDVQVAWKEPGKAALGPSERVASLDFQSACQD